jgi:hypothetical protein
LYLEETKIRLEQYKLEKEIEKLENDKLQMKLLSKDKELVNNTLQVVKKQNIKWNYSKVKRYQYNLI